MKKIVSLVLVIALAFTMMLALASCGGNNVKIAVQGGTTGEFYVKGNEDMLLPGFSNVDCKAYDTFGLAVQAMLNGQVDYVVVDNEPAKQLLAAHPNDLKMIDVALTTEQYAYGVDKEQPQLLASVNEFIAEIKTNGVLDALFDKYSSLEYDDNGNVIGGDEDIVGIESATFDANRADEQLVVATNAQFAPYEYKKGNKFVGIDIEIAALLADYLGLELVIKDMLFESVVTSVGKGGVDIAMAGLSVTATRKLSVNFSDPYYEGAYQVLLVPKSNVEFDNCTTKEQIEAIIKGK